MMRLASEFHILFVEEPVEPRTPNQTGTWEVEQVQPGLDILTPAVTWDSWPVMNKVIVDIVRKVVPDISMTTFWFYGPMFVQVLDDLSPAKIVYDCMDELSAFKNASPNVPAYEEKLLERASVVFTGGKALYEARRHRHHHVYCFPSSVDSHHFQKALEYETVVPGDIAALGKPVVGFYGVIDERLDLELIEFISTQLPTVNFVFVGPVVKIHEGTLPQANNLHYIGKRDYEVLPQYLKGFDIAMMPFAMNEATRFISPTKTLEYMAALKPIVSSAIPDVVKDYRHVVRIAYTPIEFSTYIEYYLNETSTQRKERKMLQEKIIESTSWDATVHEMKSLMSSAQPAGI